MKYDICCIFHSFISRGNRESLDKIINTQLLEILVIQIHTDITNQYLLNILKLIIKLIKNEFIESNHTFRERVYLLFRCEVKEKIEFIVNQRLDRNLITVSDEIFNIHSQISENYIFYN
jgi:hypothetical protein